MSKPIVGIIMGSDSDLDIMAKIAKTLDEFSVPNEIRVLSAHRTPDHASEYAKNAEKRGLQVIIAGAGGSAHLAGVTAAHTTLPVLAVPIKRSDHDHEALWSNVKMPPGITLATMPENGDMNTALFAVEILALSDPKLAKTYKQFREKQRNKVIEKDKNLQKLGWKKYLDK